MRCADTGLPPPASSRPPCAWSSRRTPTVPTCPASARSSPGRPRSIPTTRRSSPNVSACPCWCRTRPPSSEGPSPAGTSMITVVSGPPSEAASDGPTPAPPSGWSTPTPASHCPPTGTACSRCRRRSSVTVARGSGRPISPASTRTGSSSSSGGQITRSSAEGSRSCRRTSAPRSSAFPMSVERRSWASTTAASEPCLSRRWSSAPGTRPTPTSYRSSWPSSWRPMSGPPPFASSTPCRERESGKVDLTVVRSMFATAEEN